MATTNNRYEQLDQLMTKALIADGALFFREQNQTHQLFYRRMFSGNALEQLLRSGKKS